MWKLVVGFIAFAAAALYVLSRSGGQVDMGGEKHGTEVVAGAEAPGSAAASAASGAASAQK